jgi:hypothetical protein
MVQTKLATPTENITGFFANSLGFNLANESLIARFTIGGSNKALLSDFGVMLFQITRP